MNNEIVTVKWLSEHLHNEGLVILDASPSSNVAGKTSPYDGLCIPNSRIIDLNKKFINRESPFPNTVPSARQFEQECQALGINSTSHIVVYDNLGIYTSPRVWWLFKVMGHERVSVLDGGLVEWIKSGYPTISKDEMPKEMASGDFKSNYNDQDVITYNEVLENIRTRSFQIIDARSEGRFLGIENEPRKYLKSGHIPGSTNLPYKELLVDGKFKIKEELERIFEDRLDGNDRLVFSCGSGITACIVMLASNLAYRKSLHLYDGSWTEYAELQNLKENIE